MKTENEQQQVNLRVIAKDDPRLAPPSDADRIRLQEGTLEFIAWVLNERDSGFKEIPDRFKARMAKLFTLAEEAWLTVISERAAVRRAVAADALDEEELARYEVALSTFEVVLSDCIRLVRNKTKLTSLDLRNQELNFYTGEKEAA